MHEEYLQEDVPRFLGRQWYPDERDQNYQVPMQATDRTWRYWWPSGWWGDQGNRPWCVAFALLHELSDGPRTRQKTNPVVDPRKLYCESQLRDPWDGDCSNHQYDGTSVRAGAKALRDLGYISQFLWAFSFDQVIMTLLTHGPVIMGTSWFSDMSHPRVDDFVSPTGSYQGGHAYVLNGVNTDREVVRIKNSWGRRWGNNGYAWMKFDDLKILLQDEWAEACFLV